MAFVKQKPFCRVIGPVHPVGILKLLYIQPEHDHGIYVADPVVFRKRQHRIGFRLFPVIKKELAGYCPVGMDRKIHPSGDR